VNGSSCEDLGVIGKELVEIGLSLRVEFSEGIVDEQDGNRSANVPKKRKLGQAQGEHKSALLPLGSEVAGIPRI
jgi:hypothetical protein